MRFVLSIVYYWAYFFLRGDGQKWWSQQEVVQNLNHISTSSRGLVSNPFSLLGVNFVCRRSQQNPVFANLQSTRPGDNTSLLWLHIKIQKGMSLRVYSLCIKSITCIHSSIVFKMNECGAGLVFLGIKSIHWSHNPSAPLCSMSNRFLKHSSKCMVYSMRHNDAVQCVQKLNTQNVCVFFSFFLNQSNPQMIYASRNSTWTKCLQTEWFINWTTETKENPDIIVNMNSKCKYTHTGITGNQCRIHSNANVYLSCMLIFVPVDKQDSGCGVAQ